MLCGRSWKYQRPEANSSKVEALSFLGCRFAPKLQIIEVWFGGRT